ncbi:MAG: site-specific integrase, partial [Clostridia bacterium]|nr:site-specific integrase [Clostridia bacterium]
MGNRKAKYRELLADSDVLRWYRNVARGSLVTADVYLRRLGGFCGRHGLTPRELAAKGQKELENLLLDSVSELEEQGKAGGHIKSIVKAVKSWLSYNHCELKIKIKVKGA